MNLKKWLIGFAAVLVSVYVASTTFKTYNPNPFLSVGQPLDSLNGVKVYYNGGVNHVSGRNTTPDGYNLGLQYQCVEFVKRYYFEYLHHKMPDAYGHARDFFDPALPDGGVNVKRGLFQYRNPSVSKPMADDLLIFAGTRSNRFGHVAIISRVREDQIEIIQQNPGPFSKSRATYTLSQENGVWKIGNDRILGWLRK